MPCAAKMRKHPWRQMCIIVNYTKRIRRHSERKKLAEWELLLARQEIEMFQRMQRMAIGDQDQEMMSRDNGDKSNSDHSGPPNDDSDRHGADTNK